MLAPAGKDQGALTRASTAAVVVTWRDTELTLRALWSLQAMDPASTHLVCVAQELGEDLKVLTDRAPSGTIVIGLEENVGFAAAANLGMERALALGAAWTMLLNNDATVHPECLGRCLGEASLAGRVAALGPAVAFSGDPSRLWYSGGTFGRYSGITRHRLRPTGARKEGRTGLCCKGGPGARGSPANPPPTADTEYVPGCCMLISSQAWRELGGFCEELFLYCEDSEWCERARKAGWRCRYLGEVLCAHDASATAGSIGTFELTPTSAYYLARNPLLLARKATSRLQQVTRFASLLTVWSLRNALRLSSSCRQEAGLAYLAGIRDGLAGISGPRGGTRDANPR